jgi:hypothetical protein
MPADPFDTAVCFVPSADIATLVQIGCCGEGRPLVILTHVTPESVLLKTPKTVESTDTAVCFVPSDDIAIPFQFVFIGFIFGGKLEDGTCANAIIEFEVPLPAPIVKPFKVPDATIKVDVVILDATKVLPFNVENWVGFAMPPGTCPLIEDTTMDDTDNVE